jgi:predicted aspartyl protease
MEDNMESSTMGRVLTEATIENLGDAWNAASGQLPSEKVRRVKIPDALVDTVASSLALPTKLIQKLGLRKHYDKRIRTAAGPAMVSVYEAVRLWIGDRDCSVDVIEVPDGSPVLIGQIPLEFMDYVVDPRNQRLIGNPEHGGEWILDMF